MKFKGIELKGTYDLIAEDKFFQIYDKQGNIFYYENSKGYWAKREYDKQGNDIYYEDSNGYWCKREYDKQGNLVYHENNKGKIVDNRPKPTKELTVSEISELLGYDVKIIKGE